MNDDKKIRKPQNVIIQNRRHMSLTGVSSVESFNDVMITLVTDIGQLTIEGTELNISKLSLETGDLIVEGYITGLFYTDEQSGGGKKSGGLFSRLLK